jgi:hypothetical protein
MAANVKPIRQTNQYNCVATSLSMALFAIGLNEEECQPDRVNKVLGALPVQGASWEQCAAAANHYGCRTTLVVPATLNMVRGWTDAGFPVLIGWNPEGREWSHASLVFDVDDQFVYVADSNIPDPSQTVRKVTHQEFYGKWYEKYNGYMVRRPAMKLEREISPDGRQMVASQRVAEQLEFVYLINDPSKTSEWIDCVSKVAVRELHKMAIGFGADWQKLNVALHSDFDSAAKDAVKRINAVWGGVANVPKWVYRHGSPQMRLAARPQMYRAVKGILLDGMSTRERIPQGAFVYVGRDVQVFDRDELGWVSLSGGALKSLVLSAAEKAVLTGQLVPVSESQVRQELAGIHDTDGVTDPLSIVRMPRTATQGLSNRQLLVQRVAAASHLPVVSTAPKKGATIALWGRVYVENRNWAPGTMVEVLDIVESPATDLSYAETRVQLRNLETNEVAWARDDVLTPKKYPSIPKVPVDVAVKKLEALFKKAGIPAQRTPSSARYDRSLTWDSRNRPDVETVLDLLRKSHLVRDIREKHDGFWTMELPLQGTHVEKVCVIHLRGYGSGVSPSLDIAAPSLMGHMAKKTEPVVEAKPGKVEKVPMARNPYARQPQTGAGGHHTRERDVAKGRGTPKHKGRDYED